MRNGTIIKKLVKDKPELISGEETMKTLQISHFTLTKLIKTGKLTSALKSSAKERQFRVFSREQVYSLLNDKGK